MVIKEFNNSIATVSKIIASIEIKKPYLIHDLEKNTFSDVNTNETEIIIKNNSVILLKDWNKDVQSGSYTYFEFITAIMFRGHDVAAINWLIHEHFKEQIPFICVGTDYYKLVSKKDRYGIMRSEIKAWKLSEIKPFHGKDVIFKIPRFNDFTLDPNNVDYQQCLGDYWNQHPKFDHTPNYNFNKDNLEWSKVMVKHIFGDQEKLGWRYLQLLYIYPKKPLPILVLISEERQTGKSTFVDWLNIIFGESMVVVNPKDIGSEFNSAYANKNIVAIEESRFDSAQTLEKLKNLATQKKILVNPKHVQPY